MPSTSRRKFEQLLFGEPAFHAARAHRRPARNGPGSRSGRRRGLRAARARNGCCPMPNSVPTEAKLAMWPPSSSSLLFAFATITIAFQRQIERMRSSSVTVAGRALLHVRRDGVDVRGVGRERDVRARAARLVDQPLEQEVRALGPFALEHRLERVEPLLRLQRVGIVCGGKLGTARTLRPRNLSELVGFRSSYYATHARQNSRRQVARRRDARSTLKQKVDALARARRDARPRRDPRRRRSGLAGLRPQQDARLRGSRRALAADRLSRDRSLKQN